MNGRLVSMVVWNETGRSDDQFKNKKPQSIIQSVSYTDADPLNKIIMTRKYQLLTGMLPAETTRNINHLLIIAHLKWIIINVTNLYKLSFTNDCRVSKWSKWLKIYNFRERIKFCLVIIFRTIIHVSSSVIHGHYRSLNDISVLSIPSGVWPGPKGPVYAGYGNFLKRSSKNRNDLRTKISFSDNNNFIFL